MKLVFDIETVRQHKAWSECPENVKAAWEYVAKSKFPELEAGVAYHEKAALFPEFGKIVVISAMSSKTKEIESFTGMEFGGANAEFTLLKNFKDRIERGDWRGSQLIGHYIKGFDIPYIVTRMAAHSIEIPQLFKLYGQKPWEMTLIDTKDVWKQGIYQTSQAASLIAICLTLGVESPKQDISGGDVGEVYYSDDEDAVERIKNYCEADVRATAQVFNKMFKLKMT